MTTNILCAIDDTEHAKPALEHAADLAKRFGAKLTVCSVNVMTGSLRGPTIMAHPEKEIERTVNDGAEAARKLGAKDVSSLILEARDVGAAIVHHSQQGGFDHIVTGSGGKGALARLALGSVATYVVNRSHCPVTVVH